jgi:urease accessory protein
MILTSSAPGIFGGDSFEQRIVVEQGARVRLTSQSALQVHPSPDREAAQLSASYEIGENGELVCEWDPMIPFANARFDQRLSVTMAGTARLLWSDAFMAGRAAARLQSASGEGERWAFSELTHELSVRRAESLEYLERYRLVPSEQSIDAAWIAGEASYFGTVISSGWRAGPTAVIGLHEALAACPGVHAAADRLGEKLAIVRLMSASGARFRDARHLAATSLCRT